MKEEYQFTNEKMFCENMIRLVSAECQLPLSQIKKSIRLANVRKMVRKYSKKVGDSCFSLTADDACEICDDVASWVANVTLARQCAKDKLDCYWDNELNMMVFKDKS
jgi:histone H3/H4